MGLVISWITNIILLILFATVLELLLPNASTHRYIKLVIGLMLLLILLQPVLSLFKMDTENVISQMEKWSQTINADMEKIDDLEKSDIESVSLAYISEQVAVQLKKQANPKLIEEYGKTITDVHVTFHSLHEPADKENFSGIEVTIAPAGTSEESVKDEGDDEDIHIAKIEIENESPEEIDTEEGEGTRDMRSRLSYLWEVPEDLIILYEEGGDKE
ncbi:stage III sporulation protein AF [Salipaludibacillus sp. LMS25]|uniref:stage III sporulation protein AF n=1 Tax=Salipaludibacillus sp. LMS25 TaxID=2924031 RepID=UPI0020D1AC86|nr:stage III sporulation protein AF [Salipaludibacillus sp. LMS25]UTR14482.1 stage III sporulation protein AF [Salipaludibacillus sp. LMS25]